MNLYTVYVVTEPNLVYNDEIYINEGDSVLGTAKAYATKALADAAAIEINKAILADHNGMDSLCYSLDDVSSYNEQEIDEKLNKVGLSFTEIFEGTNSKLSSLTEKQLKAIMFVFDKFSWAEVKALKVEGTAHDMAVELSHGKSS